MGRKLGRLFHRLIPTVVLVALLLAIGPWGAIPHAVAAGNWNVNPGESIQAAIDAAEAAGGGTVNVAGGTYYEVLTLRNNVVVRGEGSSVTTIDAGGSESSVVTAIDVDSTSELSGFTIMNGRGREEENSMGGGMFNEGSSPALTDCVFSANRALGRGSGMYNSNSSPTLTNCTFSGNGAVGPTSGSGAGVYNLNSSPTLTNCVFSGNISRDGSGGGMYNDNSSPTLANCTFSENHAPGSGGGICNVNSSPTVTNCDFFYNRSQEGGGMWNSSNSSPVLTDCVFSHNGADDHGPGGGMFNSDNSSPILTGCTFSENDGGSGGGVYNSSSSPTFTSCTFSANEAVDGSGSGMRNLNSSPTLASCTFSANRSTGMEAGTGAMFNSNSSPTLTNCTFYVNEDGGLCSEGSSSPIVTNCILWGDGVEIYGEGSPVVTYSDVMGGYSGTGNINADPLLTADLHLQTGSPCIDVGSNSVPLLPAIDIDGDYRILDGDDDGPATVDMGADEAQGASLTPAAPTNVSPSNGATGVSLTPTLQSSAFSDEGETHAASQWQVRTAVGSYSSPVFNKVTAAQLTSITLSPGILNGNTTYYWHVRYTCTHGSWSEWSAETYFTTLNRPPDQPANILPTNGATGMSLTPTLESSSFSDPDSGDTHTASRWQVTATAGDYSSPVFDSNTDASHLTSIDASSLDYSTTYYWHVRHLDGHGGWSAWSVETSFATATRPPYQPSNVSPLNGTTEVSLTPTLQSSAFSDPDGGDTHAASQWQVTSAFGDYSSPVFDSLTDTVNLTSIVVPSAKLDYSNTYYWRVCYRDSQGNWSVWSEETSFMTIDRPPAQPTNVSPGSGETGTSLTPTLQASAFSDPDLGDTHAQSQWQITTTPADYSTPVWQTTSPTELASCAVPSGTLNYSTTYYWHVRYQDQHGIWSAYSGETSFTTSTRPPGQPSATAPANGATEVSLAPVLQASAFSDPDSGDTHAASQWQITSVSGVYTSTVFDSGANSEHLTQIDIASGVLGYSNLYYWHVRYQDNRGTWSEWSAEASFTTLNREPNQPVNALPSNGASGLSRSPMLQSSSFSDPDLGDTHMASQYQLTSVAGDYSAALFDSGTDAGHLTSIAVSSGTLQYSTSYYWHVRHQDSHGGWSQWSVETSFAVANQPQADFSVSSIPSSEGFIVVFFTNLSSGGVLPLTYAWDFENDGTIDATEREPWHRYSAYGTYTVSLTIRDAVGDTDTEVKPNCLTILSPTGGKMETADGHVSTEFPAGAVVGASVVTIESAAASALPETPKGFQVGNTCFVIMALDENGNEIVTLSKPSTITVKYSEADLAAAGGDPHRLVLAYWDEAAGEWNPLETNVNAEDMTLSASTTHLSTWAVLAKTTSATNGLPAWAWVLIGIGALGVVGSLGYLAFTRLRPQR